MQTTKQIAGITSILLLFAFVASAQTTKAQSAKPTAPESYCTSTGGVVENRVPAYGTNGPNSDWLRLAGSEEFCQYTGSDGSRIHLSLETLYTKEPTLAALAYYAAEPWNGQGEGNPASFYCTQLGGSDQFGGTTGAGGGWVTFSYSTDLVLEACIFPDNSTIDSWGLFYHSDGTIRGIDLSTVLRYASPYGDKKADKAKRSDSK